MAKKKPRKRVSRILDGVADSRVPVCDVAKPKDDRQLVEHVTKSACSIELTRDAKGNPKWTVKLYCEPDGVDHAVSEVLRVDDRLRKEAN